MNIKPYLPTIISALVMLSAYIAQNRGILTGDQVIGLFAALGLSGTAFAKPVRGGK